MIHRLIPAAVLLAGATVALAQNAPPAAGGGMAMDPAARYKELDTNHDGKLSLEEFQAMRMGRMGGGQGGAPGGGGGGPPGGGAPAAGAGAGAGAGGGMRMDPAERFKAADKNSDGSLSLEEFTGMMQMRRGGGGGG
jgi:hypothetical protein